MKLLKGLTIFIGWMSDWMWIDLVVNSWSSCAPVSSSYLAGDPSGIWGYSGMRKLWLREMGSGDSLKQINTIPITPILPTCTSPICPTYHTCLRSSTNKQRK